MKKLLLTILCMLTIAAANAQSSTDDAQTTISSDDVSPEGRRVIHGQSFIARDFSDRVVHHYHLRAIQRSPSDTIQYALALDSKSSTPYTIANGMLLLIKTMDGEVLELKSENKVDATVRTVHTGAGSFVYSDYGHPAYYPITEQQLQTLSTGILKIKQEISTGAFEKEYKKDKIGKKLKQQYEDIRKAFSSEKSFRDGF